jgi:hypothetical protein
MPGADTAAQPRAATESLVTIPPPFSPSGSSFKPSSEVMFKPASTRPSTSTTTNQLQISSHGSFLSERSEPLLGWRGPSKRKTGHLPSPATLAS